METHILESTLDVENLLRLVKKLQKAGNLEPRIEDLVDRIDKLQKARKLITEEVSGYNAQCEKLREELDLLNDEKSHLEETLNEKREACRILQLQCEQREAETQRQKKLSDECKQRIEELTSQIQEEKLKQSKQRLEFEKQLEELMKKHKSLWEFHTEKRLASEIDNMESRKKDLLAEEKDLEEKLGHLLQQLESIDRRGPAFREEMFFLHSQEAATAVQLFEEENKAASALLEELTRQHSETEQRCQRLKEELEVNAGGPQCIAMEVVLEGSVEKARDHRKDDETPEKEASGRR
ncbi:synaptonemal complex central element protein 1-like isoform X2 [Lissotriton helveticus]